MQELFTTILGILVSVELTERKLFTAMLGILASFKLAERKYFSSKHENLTQQQSGWHVVKLLSVRQSSYFITHMP